jgi:hypothetical protein
MNGPSIRARENRFCHAGGRNIRRTSSFVGRSGRSRRGPSRSCWRTEPPRRWPSRLAVGRAASLQAIQTRRRTRNRVHGNSNTPPATQLHRRQRGFIAGHAASSPATQLHCRPRDFALGQATSSSATGLRRWTLCFIGGRGFPTWCDRSQTGACDTGRRRSIPRGAPREFALFRRVFLPGKAIPGSR